MRTALKYAAWHARHPRDLRGLLFGATLRDLVLRRDLVRLGIDVPFSESRGFGAASLKTSLVPRLRKALGARTPRTVLDVGAQYGQFARAAGLAFPGCRVYAFEPIPASHERLLRALRHQPTVTALPFALGDEDAACTLKLSRNPGSSSILPMTSAHTSAFPGTEQGREISITVRRLDSLVADGTMRLERPVLLKIDVQGFEDRVIAGCGSVLDSVDAVIVEMSTVALYEGQSLVEEVRASLEARGLRYGGQFDRIESATTGKLVQEDGLFLRD